MIRRCMETALKRKFSTARERSRAGLWKTLGGRINDWMKVRTSKRRHASSVIVSALAIDAAGGPWKITRIVTYTETKKFRLVDLHIQPNRNPNSAWPGLKV